MKPFKIKTTPFNFGVVDMPKYRINKAIDTFIRWTFYCVAVVVLCIAYTAYKGCEQKEKLKKQNYDEQSANIRQAQR